MSDGRGEDKEQFDYWWDMDHLHEELFHLFIGAFRGMSYSHVEDDMDDDNACLWANETNWQYPWLMDLFPREVELDSFEWYVDRSYVEYIEKGQPEIVKRNPFRKKVKITVLE